MTKRKRAVPLITEILRSWFGTEWDDEEDTYENNVLHDLRTLGTVSHEYHARLFRAWLASI